MMMRMIAVMVLMGLAPLAAPAGARAGTDCQGLLGFSAPGLAITGAREIPAGPYTAPPGAPPLSFQAPAYCRIDGLIGGRTDTAGHHYGIHFAVAMPDQWNGRLLYQGGGGLDGSVQAPIGAVAAGATPALARGFAVVTSDSGHEGAVFDPSFLHDQQAAMDFLYEAIGKVMRVARPMIVAHYGNPIAHSYFVGCSTGGREAMIASQRYPFDFDGIVAGSPAMRTNYSNLGLRWVTVALNTAAPTDAQGHAITARALSDTDRHLIIAALLKSCDGLDGVRDGMIFDVRGCHFDPEILQCPGSKNDSCLSSAQVQAIRRAFAGPTTASGIQVYPGYAYDTGIAFHGRFVPGLLYGGTIPEGPTPTGTSMNVEAEAFAAHDGREMAGDTDAWTNLSSFRSHGGKLIFYHGVSDPWFSALDTVGYYERLAKDNGPGPVQDWSRLFLVPGMGHCGGGTQTLDRFDMLSAIVDWVEKHQAPARVIATGADYPGRSRPLCPYPTHAQYVGHGNSESAAQFSCRE